MNPLIAKAHARRETWVELEAGKRVKVRRPPEGHFPRFYRATEAEQYLRCCVDWEVFTEADIAGAAYGAGDVVVPFDVELWVVVAMDNVEWITKVQSKLVEVITAFLDAKKAAAKNSDPS
jgi:hypothetical protein